MLRTVATADAVVVQGTRCEDDEMVREVKADAGRSPRRGPPTADPARARPNDAEAPAARSPVRSCGAPPVVFIHVMKTAGTTFMTQVLHVLDPARVWPPQTRHLAPGRGRIAAGAQGSYGQQHEILAADPQHLLGHDVIAGHHPAVLVDVLASRFGGRPPSITLLRHPVERTISHLRMNRSLHGAEGAPLEAVYEDPRFHEPFFRSHQTKVLSTTVDELREPPAGSEPARQMAEHPEVVALLRAAAAGDIEPGTLHRRLAERAPDGWDAKLFAFNMATPPGLWAPIDDRRVRDARRRLATFDVVGVTERYGAFADVVGRRFGWSLPDVGRRRAGPDDEPVPRSLRRRIEADNEADLEVYESARALAV